MSLNLPSTTPGKPLSSIMNTSVKGSGLSLKSIWKDVEEANPNMTKQDQMRTAKTIRQLAVDPSKVVSKSKMKAAISALSTTGRLKAKYKDKHSAAIREIKKQHAAIQEGTQQNISEQTKRDNRERRLIEQAEKDAAHGAGNLTPGATRDFTREQMSGAKVSAVRQGNQRPSATPVDSPEEEAIDVMID